MADVIYGGHSIIDQTHEEIPQRFLTKENADKSFIFLIFNRNLYYSPVDGGLNSGIECTTLLITELGNGILTGITEKALKHNFVANVRFSPPKIENF